MMCVHCGTRRKEKKNCSKCKWNYHDGYGGLFFHCPCNKKRDVIGGKDNV